MALWLVGWDEWAHPSAWGVLGWQAAGSLLQGLLLCLAGLLGWLGCLAGYLRLDTWDSWHCLGSVVALAGSC